MCNEPVEYKALKVHEDELIESLEEADLVSLSKQAADHELITDNVKVILKSLHSSVAHPIKCRYLLYSVYKYGLLDANKKIISEAYSNWLKLLSKVKTTAGVLSLIRHWCSRYDPNISGKQDQNVACLLWSEKHISDLTEVLAGCSSMWKEIATALDLPSNEIKNIMAMMHAYIPTMCLKEVFTLWVRASYSYAKAPTLENLKEALRSEIVGLGREANKLSDTFFAQDIKEPPKSHSSKVAGNLAIVGQSSNLCVDIGTTALFQVQVSSPDPLDFHWRDGDGNEAIPFSHAVSSSYGGNYVSILSLRAIDLTAEGIYKCHVIEQDKSLGNYSGNVRHLRGGDLISQPISLTVSTTIDEYTSVLYDFYTEQPEVPEDTWPPVNGNTFINLALIKQKGISHAGAYGRYTIRGDIDDIYSNKEGIVYDTAFSNLVAGARVLVEGRPGSGKTTLVHKISQDWAKDKLKFSHTRLLLMVHLRAFSSDPKISLQDTLKCYYRLDSTITTIEEYAEKYSGLGLCFMLDGLDEYLPNTTNTFIYKLIKKQVFPKSVVIIASRPAAAASFRSVATRHVEVIGFLKAQVYEYIEEFPFSGAHKCEGLHRYLEEHPNVHHMCYLPIHAAMICFLFDNLESDLPQTETEIYSEFTKYTILRILYRREGEPQVCMESIEDLDVTQRELYSKICKLAYEMTVSSKQVMNQIEVQSFFNVHDEKDTLGLVTVDRLAKRSGFQNLYTFLHLTFQEFLGAYFISNLKKEDQMKLISELCRAKQMQQVWKFYCGLSTFHDGCPKFKALISSVDYGSLYKVQCCFESQQSHICNTVIENNSLSLTSTFLSPSNFSEIGYVISHANSNPIVRLTFDRCTFEAEGVDVLVMKAGESISQLTTLCCYKCELQIVKYLLHSLPMLKVLDVSNTELDFKAIYEGLNHPNLQILKVGSRDNVLYSSEGLAGPLMVLEKFKSSCRNFENVCFSGIGPNQPSIYTDLLKVPFFFHCNFPDLKILFCPLGLSGIEALHCEFINSPFYTKVTLVDCGIDDTSAASLARGLKFCTELEVLKLSFNNIGDDGAVEIAHIIEHWKQLKVLDLAFNKIGDKGALALAVPDKEFSLLLDSNSI